MKRILVTIWVAVAAAAILWVVYQDQTAQPQQAATGTSQSPRSADPLHVQDSVPDRIPVETAPLPGAGGAPAAVNSPIVLTGILLLEDGKPVAGARCVWSLQGSNRSMSGRTVTDGDGRFRIPGPVDLHGTTRMLRLRTRRDDAEKAWGYTECVIASEYPPGEHDIGFLQIDLLPHIATGRVVTTDGAPVAGARVYAMPEQVDLGAFNDEGYAERLSCTTDAQGRFAVHGRLAGATATLVARHADHFQLQPVIVAIGADNALVEVGAAGSLAGSVQVGPGISTRQLAVELTGAAVVGHLGASDGPVHTSARPRAEGESLRVPVAADGTFEVGMLRPGLVDCAVHCVGLTHAVAGAESVQIRAGEVARDQRLQAIDLRNLRVLPLTIVDAAGQPVEGLPIGVRDVGMKTWERRVSGPGGRVLATTAIGSIDVLVQDGGYQRQLLTDVRGERVITLGQGIPVTLTFALGEPVPDFEVAVRLVGGTTPASPASVDMPRSATHVIEPWTPTEFRVPGPGLYQLEVTVRVRGGPPLHARQTTDLQPLEIEVPAGGNSGIFEVRLGADAIGKAVRQIRFFFPTAGIIR